MALTSSEDSNLTGKNFQIYSVQITGKCISEIPNPYLAWSDD